MSEASRKIPPTSPIPPFALELVDLNAHPDGDLMRNCAEATKILDLIEIARRVGECRMIGVVRLHHRRLNALHQAIAESKPQSVEGWHAKAVYALIDDEDGKAGGMIHNVAYAAVRDAIRLGVLS